MRGLFYLMLLGAAVAVSAGKPYIRVADGDSLEEGRRRIRLLHIDAPEYRQYCFDAKGNRYECGKEARRFLDDLLKKEGYKVVCKTVKKDIYTRDLSVCYAGDKNINLEMVRAGQAVAYRTQDTAYLTAEKQAKKHKKGIWQGKFMRPEYYRKLHKAHK